MADNDSRPEEPLKEQAETPEPVVSKAVAVPVPVSNDPFDKFLFNLAAKGREDITAKINFLLRKYKL